MAELGSTGGNLDNILQYLLQRIDKSGIPEGGTGGVTRFANLSDVPAPTSGKTQYWGWTGSAYAWLNATGGGGTTDLANYYTKAEVNNLITGYATETWVKTQGYLTSVSWGGIQSKPTTLEGYGVKDDIDTILAGYVTNDTFRTFKSDYDNLAAAVAAANGYTDGKIANIQQWVNNKGYATNSTLIQAINGANATAYDYATQAYDKAVDYADGKFVTKAVNWEVIDGIKMLNGTYTFFKTLYIEPETSYGAYIGWQNGPVAMNILTNGRIKFRQGIQDNIELYGGKDAQSNNILPFFGFHFNDTVTDFSSRIIESAQGVLEIQDSTKLSGTLKIGNAYITYDSDNNALFVKGKDGAPVNLVATGDVAAFSGLGSGFDTLTDLTLTNKLTTRTVDTKELTAKTSATIARVRFYEDDDSCPVIDLTGDGENRGYITGMDMIKADRFLTPALWLFDSIDQNYKVVKYDGANDYIYITIDSVKYKLLMEKV